MTRPRPARRPAEIRPDPLRRWKIATGVLALTSAFFVLRPARGCGSDPISTEVVPGEGTAASASRAATLRQLRVPAHMVGLDEDAILRDLAHARSLQQVQILCERLGFVGTDRSLELLGKLAADRRAGVPDAAIAALGHIGTDRATSLLLSLSESGATVRVREAAVGALGRTGQARARERLMQLAARRGDPQRLAAIVALGDMGGGDVIDLFRAMPDRSRPVMHAMVQAAATIGDDEAEAFLLETATSSAVHAEIRAAALAALPSAGDEGRQEMMMEVLAGGDPGSAAAAATVLGRARAEEAVPLLLDVARAGNYQSTYAAMSALAEIGTPEAVNALGDLVAHGTYQLGQQAAYALAQAGTAEARALLVKAARAQTGDRTAVLSALTQIGGDEVEKLLLEVARTGDLRDRQTALQHLLQIGHPDAAALVTELATTGPRQQRQSFLYMMGQLDEDAARESLWNLARSSSGYTRLQALEMLSQANPGDPKITASLVEIMQRGRRDEAGSAVYSLARSGTAEGRDALLAALSGGDRKLAGLAAGAAGQLLGDPEMAAAMMRAARSSDPEVVQAALGQLVQNRLPQGIQLAGEMVQRGKPEEAAQAVQLLSSVGSPESQRLVREAGRQSDPQVRLAAASALSGATDAASGQMLIELSKDRDTRVRSAAMSGLGQLGTDDAMNVLTEAARTGATQDRQAAVQALASVEDARASRVIAELIGSSEPDVAASAIGACYSGGEDVDKALAVALGSAHQQVRTAAAYQLRARGQRLGADIDRQVEALIGPE